MKSLCVVALIAASLTTAFSPHSCLDRLAECSAASNGNQQKPAISLLKTEDAAKIKKQAQGRVLVVNFWATWCHGCVSEFPEFVALDKEYRNKGVKIIGISLDQPSDIDSKVTPFIKKSGAQFEVVVPDMEDPKPVIDQLTPEWTGAMPVTLIFDQSGALVYKHFGVIDRNEVVGELKHLLNN